MMDWRIALGGVLTVVWIVGGILYLNRQPDSLFAMHIDELGGFLEGAFVPLAFMWLVIGLFVQQKELASNTEIMRQSMLQGQQQAEAVAALEVNTRQEAFFKISQNVQKQLGMVTGMQFISAFGGTEGNVVPDERIRELLQALSLGDDTVFVREFLSNSLPMIDQRTLVFYGTEIRRRHSMNYREAFERLVNLAAGCDSDGLISGTVTNTAFGLLYNLLLRHAPAEVTIPADTSLVAVGPDLTVNVR